MGWGDEEPVALGAETPLTAADQMALAEARQREEGMQARPVETREVRAETPLPPAPAAIVTKIVEGMEARIAELTEQLAGAEKELRVMSEELSDARDSL